MTTNPERAIVFEVEVAAPREAVWRAWTTEAGVRSFFAPGAHLDVRPGGAYEIFFMPEGPPGMRGADGMLVLAVQAPAMLSFTWNAPPSLPEARAQMTHVVVRLYALADGRTRVRLVHSGWGEGGQWDEAFAYFTRAWSKMVLPRLRHRFAVGAVDWDAPPPVLD